MGTVTDGFEAWTRSEVRRLRAEADQLEMALAKYADATSGRMRTERTVPTSPRTVAHAKPSDTVTDATSTGKNAPLMRALDEAGASGLSVDEVHDAARRNGLKSGRGAIRSYLWNQKHAGRVVALPAGRYALAVHLPPGGGDPEGSAAAPAGHGDGATQPT